MVKKIIFNSSNIIKGGAIQAAVNFLILNNNIEDRTFEWYLILSKEVKTELDNLGVVLKNKFLILYESPSKSKLSRKKALEFERLIKPSLVFSLFGPSYIKFNSFHLSGFANGWVTHSTFKTFKSTYKNDNYKILKSVIKYVYYAYQIRKASAWIFETQTALNGFVGRLHVNRSNCFIVPNSALDFGDSFEKKPMVSINNIELLLEDKNFIALSANYPHKNLISILKAIIPMAKESKHFKVIFTLDDLDFSREFGPFIKKNQLDNYVVNIGTVSFADLPKLYSVAYASVLPSFIETFSAVYPESMSTYTPIITTDANFSREICKDSALYVNSLSHESIANAMELLLNDDDLYLELSLKGKRNHTVMLSAEEKYNSYLSIINELIK